MPTVRATDYPYQAFPTTQPSTSVPTDYFQPRTSAEMFGGGTGQALERLGQTFGQASDRLAAVALERQDLQNRIVADQQISSFEDKINKTLYGDPDSPGDVGYMGLKGQAALDARAPTRATIDKILQEHRAVLQNPHQQLAFDNQTRRYRNIVLADIGRHYDSEFNRNAQEVMTGRAQTSLNTAGIAANRGDDSAWEAAWQSGRAAFRDGLSKVIAPELVDAKVQEFDEKAVTDYAQKLATRDPVAADAFVERNAKYLPNNYDNLKKSVKGEVGKATANYIATGVGAPSLVRGGGTSAAIERFLDMAEEKESGGRNIEQNVVPAGGGYNPSVGRVTGPSSASGNFQIVDTTWREFAPKAGVDLKQYPRAISAPYDVQREVARTIATTSGVQHWTDYNARLRVAVSNEGLPVSGPIRASKPVGDKPPDQLITNLPEPEQGAIPDNELGKQYQDALESAAERATKAGASVQNWHDAVRILRRRYNEQYVDQQRVERMKVQAQQKTDHEVGDQFVRRMDPESDNPVTMSEILQSPMSVAAKENLVRFQTVLAQPGPAPRVSAANQAKLFDRIHAPDDREDKIRDEKAINDSFINREISWEARKELINDFRDAYTSTKADWTKAEADVLKANRNRIRPSLVYQHGELIEQTQDPEGPNREVKFKQFISRQVQEAVKAGKDPVATVLNPDSPEYVGKQVDRFSKAGPGVMNKLNEGKGAQSFAEPKNMGDVKAQLAAGRWGPASSDEARAAAYAEAVRRGYIAAPSQAPVR